MKTSNKLKLANLTTWTKEPLFWTENNDYKYYIPFDSNGKNFILLFTQVERYGNKGSF